MKRNIITSIIALSAILFFASCNKHEQRKEEEIVKLEKYISDLGIGDSLQSDSGAWYPVRSFTGMYYIEKELGRGEQVLIGDQVYFRYRCYDLESNYVMGNFEWSNSQVITIGNVRGEMPEVFSGFHEGLSRMRSGGTATFIMPSTLMYGAGGGPILERYTSARFEVRVTDVVRSRF